ncbi:hypothetical protein NP233_g4255 [Leucocoprinus birnbaumii]|uniref:F-box domain-containing protein n=1 Tax=Leucocoprinus birnbaumii TaxID=56174 RepID=A0AAD5VVE1_9AGAR|nr:hypothetical protein NP233_g4255 [Leucocoprinus birnbaumii]
MASPCRSAWEGLPPEIYEQVLAYMDDDMLLTLSKVNRLFNYTVLNTFLDAMTLDEVLDELKFSNIPPRCMSRTNVVEALRLSLRVQRLEHIHFRLSASSPLNELQSMKLLIDRLPTLNTLELELRGAASDNRELGFSLARAAADACDSAVAKGCETLKLERLLSFGPPGREPYSASLNHTPRPYSQTIKRLGYVHLCGAFLLSPLLTYTPTLLQSCSQTIHTLCFDVSTIIVPRLNWDEFLSSLYLPNLQTFLFDNVVHTRLAPACISKFLKRHPGITTLRLYYGLLRSHDLALQTTQPPALPNLVKLEASRGILTWLFQDPSSCLNVNEVTIPHVDDPIEVLYPIVGPSRAFQSNQLKIVIKLNPLLRLWLDWMGKLIESEGSGEKNSRLKELRVVRLAFRFDAAISSLDEKAVLCLARFVALIPGLRHLEMIRDSSESEEAEEEVTAERVMYNTVFEACPNLASFTFVSSD